MDIKETKEVITISTNSFAPTCKFGCKFPYNGEDIESVINHYLKEHNCTLLHVGSESSRTFEGEIFNSTVAIVGTENT